MEACLVQHLLELSVGALVASLEARGLPLEVTSLSLAPGEALTVVVARGPVGVKLQRLASELGTPALQGQLALPFGMSNA